MKRHSNRLSRSADMCFCDDCGEPVYMRSTDPLNPREMTELRAYRVFESVPFDVASANAGESAVVCFDCCYQHDFNPLYGVI